MDVSIVLGARRFAIRYRVGVVIRIIVAVGRGRIDQPRPTICRLLQGTTPYRVAYVVLHAMPGTPNKLATTP